MISIRELLGRRVLAGAGAVLLLAAPCLVAAQGVPVRADSGRQGNIEGRVLDADGKPVADVRVDAGPRFHAVSDSTGAFALRGLPVGLVELYARHVGFAPLITQWELGPHTLTIDLRMHANPTVLPTVSVQARAEPYASRLEGFYTREKTRRGYYITREDIERGQTHVMTEALARLPGVRRFQMPGALGESVRFVGEQCPPLVMVDGFPAALGRFDLDGIDLSTVEGIEVYHSGASVPPELAGPYGMENCGLIAIWSRPMRPNVRANQLPPEHALNLDSLLQAKAVYTAGTVDVPASYLAGSSNPIYPDSLYRARVSGRVVARFVVDTAGAVEPRSVVIVSFTDSLFAEAVRRGLHAARFRAARVGGLKVRQMVEMPFDFMPKPAEADTTGRGSARGVPGHPRVGDGLHPYHR